ncbi:ATP-binding protein [Fodinicola feengrottensis]|uniref:ATP-binding protein n=1 Tax=Fodinicola feengrottensis TaxID=435914 RepID=UPI0013D5D673|nr:ATP-binding protein [Fodinicola feengrottensis]
MGQLPFVGRAKEIAAVRASLDHGGAVVAGPAGAGVGKTRLVSEIVDRLDLAQFTVHRAYGTHAAAGIPLGAFAALLPERALRAEGGAAVRLLVDELTAALVATDRRIVVAVDDAQLLDSASATVVDELVRRGEVAVLLTVRTDGEAAFDDTLTRLDLRPLPPDQTTELLETYARRAGRASHRRPDLARQRRQPAAGPRAGGRRRRAGGALQRRAGRWRWDGGLALSARLNDLVRSQMGGLSEAERGVLEMLSIGEPLSVPALAAGDLPRTLERRGLVRVAQDGQREQVWLAHPLYGETVRAELGTLRANRLRRELAEQVRAAGANRRGDVLRMAVCGRWTAANRRRPRCSPRPPGRRTAPPTLRSPSGWPAGRWRTGRAWKPW